MYSHSGTNVESSYLIDSFLEGERERKKPLKGYTLIRDISSAQVEEGDRLDTPKCSNYKLQYMFVCTTETTEYLKTLNDDKIILSKGKKPVKR